MDVSQILGAVFIAALISSAVDCFVLAIDDQDPFGRAPFIFWGILMLSSAMLIIAQALHLL